MNLLPYLSRPRVLSCTPSHQLHNIHIFPHSLSASCSIYSWLLHHQASILCCWAGPFVGHEKERERCEHSNTYPYNKSSKASYSTYSILHQIWKITLLLIAFYNTTLNNVLGRNHPTLTKVHRQNGSRLRHLPCSGNRCL